MAIDRTMALLSYLQTLSKNFDALGDEKAVLQQAATRIVAIDALRADLLTDAQTALARYNTLAGTTLTLQDIRKMFNPTLGA